MPKPVLVLGATSLVGVALAKRSDTLVVHCVAPMDRGSDGPTVRVEEVNELASLVEDHAPGTILYCHAVCDVGRCEQEPAWANEVNVGGVRNLLQILPSTTRLVYVSSDHVFGNDGSYDEEAVPRPISVYGHTRIAAEALVGARDNTLVVRPGLAVGRSKNGRTGHFDWLRHRSQRGLPISIVSDEARSAVWAEDLAERLMQLCHSSLVGVRNLPATRMVSRPELALHLMKLQGLPPEFQLICRADKSIPHLGRVELRSVFQDSFAVPLPSVADGPMI